MGIVSKSDEIIAKYDGNNNRVIKIVNDEVTRFKYTDDLYLEYVFSQDGTIRYMYDFVGDTNVKYISGFVYDAKEYKFLYDTYYNIIGIKYNNVDIVRYMYDEKGSFKCTLCNLDGRWLENNDPSFIGNINKIRFKQTYYDDETTLYYNGRYYCALQSMYLDCDNMSKIDILLSEKQILGENSFNLYFMPPINAFASMSNIEIICRILYCEAGSSSMDWDAVAWSVYYRISTNGRTALAELTGGEFAAYNNENYLFSTTNWYNQSKWNICYENAQRLNSGLSPNRTVQFISNQKYFNSVNIFISHYDSDGVSTSSLSIPSLSATGTSRRFIA